MNTVTASVKTAAKATTSAASSTVKTAAKVISSAEKEYTWDELEAIETRRRAILKRSEEPFWGILAHWDGTVLPSIFTDSLFWITVGIYILIRVWARTGIPDYVVDLGSGDIAVIGGFLSFFLVFYVNQSNTRFFTLYNCSMACKGRIFDTATLVVATLPKEVGCRVVRYMNAAHVAGYTGLSKTYPASSFFAQLNKNLGLLTDKELVRLQEIDLNKGGSCQRECIAWAMKDVQNQYRKGVIDAELAYQLRDLLLQLRASFASLYNAADLVCFVCVVVLSIALTRFVRAHARRSIQPVPFFYVHFICLLSALYLPLFAISAGYKAGTGADVYWTADAVAGLVVILQAIFVIGLRILGQKMDDPYGDDLEDLSVIWYCTFTWRMSQRVLNARFPTDEPSERVEKQLIRDRSDSIGNAFEEDSFHTINTDDEDEDVDGLQDGAEWDQGPKSRFWFHRSD